jgi:hypothetical protein
MGFVGRLQYYTRMAEVGEPLYMGKNTKGLQKRVEASQRASPSLENRTAPLANVVG